MSPTSAPTTRTPTQLFIKIYHDLLSREPRSGIRASVDAVPSNLVLSDQDVLLYEWTITLESENLQDATPPPVVSRAPILQHPVSLLDAGSYVVRIVVRDSRSVGAVSSDAFSVIVPMPPRIFGEDTTVSPSTNGIAYETVFRGTIVAEGEAPLTYQFAAGEQILNAFGGLKQILVHTGPPGGFNIRKGG
eukprot:jgi/Bigna1/84730/fgenesh1_pg.250_\